LFAKEVFGELIGDSNLDKYVETNMRSRNYPRTINIEKQRLKRHRLSNNATGKGEDLSLTTPPQLSE